ncbi:diguanylate cyclase (GGDEF)-like protein [Halanaerobium saccharolyticum]|uniref:Diguanylate cyclase (GGDEF)-like protein n=1 Tax=Halanaerobium saccharolyticum TaxID=43595 RepID=A0A4R7YPS3_9FIRM|nr:EAL domain-containing protein [Halanaerobium saccharolyticum]RAK05187.1 diguanylate cyclase (GGDEF)-like protein [Halanaerobium saccharolyticum]TDV99018.1 diguanylate cyclase (GGDEF)-like protein [Halanaerobium saccharolyticum]TDX51709.1 diguanylate cyclase (GGDEF)-like protein [Halanaerobium saccharolyticum]
MRILKNLTIQNKILLGIGLSFILAMIFLLAIVIYQFEDLSAENQVLIEKELLERKYDKYETLVKSRAEILSEIYHLRLEEIEARGEELNESDMRLLMAELNDDIYIEDVYFYIYDLEGTTVSLPPTPALEGKNRSDLEINGVPIVKNMIRIINQEGGGRFNYLYHNPRNGMLENKYSYIQKISGTEMFVGSGGYQSSYYNIVDRLLLKISNVRDETIYLLLISFAIIVLIIFLIIFDISEYINSNLKQIVSAFKRVEKGQLNFKLDIKSEDEFGSLAAGFNQMLKRIKKLTYNDPLTGLPNLNFLENNLSESLKENAENDKHIYLFTLITDNMTLVNSNYGYQKGNEILRELYQRLGKNLSEEMTIARKSDEFVFYFASNKDKAEIREFAGEILNNLSEPYEVNNNLIYLKLKLGIAVNENQESCSELIRKSRLALHFVDEKNSIKFFDQEMMGQLSGRLNLESQLRKAIENDEFELHYQPQLESKTNKVVGVEALIRWQHPEKGRISPGEFIPLAEESGMILKLGDWVLNEALCQLKTWHNKGHSDLISAVNIAPQQFQQDDFVSNIDELLKKHQLEAKYLELEITERTVIKDIEYTVDILNRLKKLGVRISIDDFGTGYSSLEYLNRFALDKLKIDKSFVHNRSNLNIVKTIIMMGSNLGLEVVAEGVETKEELDFLIKNNCNYYQGYYFARAEKAADVEEYFSK